MPAETDTDMLLAMVGEELDALERGFVRSKPRC